MISIIWPFFGCFLFAVRFSACYLAFISAFVFSASTRTLHTFTQKLSRLIQLKLVFSLGCRYFCMDRCIELLLKILIFLLLFIRCQTKCFFRFNYSLALTQTQTHRLFTVDIFQNENSLSKRKFWWLNNKFNCLLFKLYELVKEGEKNNNNTATGSHHNEWEYYENSSKTTTSPKKNRTNCFLMA